MSFSNIMDSNSYQGGQLDDPLIAARNRVLGPAYRLFYEKPVHLVRASGTKLFDADGNDYLDAYNNVASVGHCHPHVIDAVTRQLSTLNTHTRYLHEGIVDYSQRLLATFPDPGPGGSYQIMYACTGSEVNDLALRVAAMHTGATGIIVTEEAYHGNTAAVNAISPSIGGRTSLGSHVRTVSPQLEPAEIAAAIADLRENGFGVSALIVDTIFSSDGIYPDPLVLAPAVSAVRAAGGVLIADEVQPGFGRTGQHMWGYQRHNVIPDIVTMGKPMGNGQPIAGLLVTEDAVARFGRDSRYFNTFAGNTVSCAAAVAVLDTIEQEGLIEHAEKIGNELRDGIAALAGRHQAIGDVRGVGMFVGVEIVSDRATREADRETTSRVVNLLRDKGILISACAMGHNVLKIRPPLVLTSQQVEMVVQGIDEAFAEAGAAGAAG